jgi:hypothetical protein
LTNGGPDEAAERRATKNPPQLLLGGLPTL